MATNAYAQKLQQKKWVTCFRCGMAFFLIIFVLSLIGLDDLVFAIKNCRLLPFLGVIFCVFSLILIGSVNIWLLLNSLTKISFMTFLKVYSYSWAMSLITPGQAGDATIILLMKKYSVPISLTSSAYFVDKIITLSLFVAISAYGVSYLIPIQEITYQSTVNYLLLVLFVFVAVFFLMSIKLKIFNKLRRFLGGVRQNLVILKNDHRILLANIVLTVVKWIVVSWSFHYAFLSFGITIEWPDIGVIPIMSTLVGYIPISIGGIGTVELSATYWFGLKDVPATIVVTSYIFMRLINYFLALGVIVVMNPFKAE